MQSAMIKSKFHNDHDEEYLKARNRFDCALEAYKTVNHQGEEEELKVSNKWEFTEDAKGAYRRIVLPKGFEIDSDLVIGLVSKGYNGDAASFEFDRVVHVIQGEVLDPITKKRYRPEDSPIEIPAGKLFNTHGVDDAVLIIQLFPNEE